MILGFMTKFPWGAPTDFERKIKTGIKIHTVRDDNAERWKIGRSIQYYKHVRTQDMAKIADDGVCTEINTIHFVRVKEKIEGYQEEQVNIYIDGCLLPENQHEVFATNDGFENTTDLYRYFLPEGSTIYTGKLIYWASYRYATIDTTESHELQRNQRAA